MVGGGYIGLEMGTVYAELGQQGVGGRADRRPAAGGRSRPGQAAGQAAARHCCTSIHLEYQGGEPARRRASRSRSRWKGGRATARMPSIACWSRSGGGRSRSGIRAGKHQGDGRRARVSSSRRAAARPPTRTSWPSATWPASRCWPTRRRTKARSPPKCWPANRPRSSPLAIPAVVFTDPEIAWAGLTADEAKRDGRDGDDRAVSLAGQRPGDGHRPTDGLTKWLVDPETDRVLGCGIVGSGAGRTDRRGGGGHRDGLHGPRRGRLDPPPSHAQRNASPLPAKSTWAPPPRSTDRSGSRLSRNAEPNRRSRR